MPTWQLQRDLAIFPGLRMRMHRIGLAHWHAGARLRSWGVAPLHRRGDALHVACRSDEALWLGAWPIEDDGDATLVLQDEAAALTASIALPHDFQLTGLRDGAGHDHPIALPDAQARRELRIALHSEGVQFCIPLVLHPPSAWARLAVRDAPTRLAGPPALPPRLG